MRNDAVQLGRPAIGALLVRLGASAQGRLDELVRATGIALPSRPGIVASGMPVALWRAPCEWLVLTEECAGHAELLAQMQSLLAEATALVVDYSDASTVIELNGTKATDVLARGCALDFASWPEQGTYCVPAAYARIPVLIHRLAPTRFWLHVDRSLEHYVWTWLSEVVEDL